MKDKPKGKGLRDFLSWEAARDQDSEGHQGRRLKALAFALLILLLTCALTVWTCND